jgi:hypothetical protein
MRSLLKTLKTNPSNSSSNQNVENKFNPDIKNNFNQAKQDRETTKYDLSTTGYKTIINEKVSKVVKSQEDLKIAYEKATEENRQITLKKLAEIDNERKMENQKLASQIDHNKKLDELIKVKRRELIGEKETYQASTHSELKQIQINQNDKIKAEKEKFNSIVNSLNDILKN